MARFQCNVISYVLGRTVDITVIIPTVTIPETLRMGECALSHKIEEKYPVLYLLHGKGNNHATWCGYSNIELYAEERNIAVVMISGENKFYRTVPNGDDHYRFLEDELPEFITNMFPVSDKPEQTYLAGLSMGGAGSLMHGLGNPEKFGAIGAFSSAVKVEGEDEEERADPRNLVVKARESGKKIPPVYLSCGAEDFLLKNNQMLKDFLQSEGVDVTWSCVPGFGHEWRFWNQQIEKFLDWIPRTDIYAARGKRRV